MDDTDRSTLARVAAGDQRALAELYTRHGQALLAYAEGLLGERQAAEEALQDTFLAVWRAAASFEGRSAVRTGLFGICRRQALTRLRRPGPGTVPVDSAGELPAGEPGPEAIALARADARAVGAAISALSPRHREVLDLAFGAGMSYRDIATVLGVPEGTVKSRLFQARNHLARALAPVSEPVPGPRRGWSEEEPG